MNNNRYVNEKEVSRITGISCSTLQKHRFMRKGIPYIKIGKSVFYCLADVYEYMNRNRISHEW